MPVVINDGMVGFKIGDFVPTHTFTSHPKQVRNISLVKRKEIEFRKKEEERDRILIESSLNFHRILIEFSVKQRNRLISRVEAKVTKYRGR